MQSTHALNLDKLTKRPQPGRPIVWCVIFQR